MWEREREREREKERGDKSKMSLQKLKGIACGNTWALGLIAEQLFEKLKGYIYSKSINFFFKSWNLFRHYNSFELILAMCISL